MAAAPMEPAGNGGDEVVEALRGAGCVSAEDEARVIRVAATRPADLDRMVSRRCAGEPLELVVGYADFAGVRVTVRPGVFVPRPRSEQLVRAVVRRLGLVEHPAPVVVDLGCGSGALLLALLGLVRCAAYAIDSSTEAVRCARGNLTGTAAVVIEGVGLGALPAAACGGVDVIMANLPYVPTAAIALLPREARLYEPWSALDGGSDGLTPLSAAVKDAPTWLRPGGHYLGELHESQVEAAASIADRHGFVCVASVDQDDGTAVIDLTMSA